MEQAGAPRRSDAEAGQVEMRPKGALLRNIFTVLLLVSVPLIGLVAVWTIAPWNRRAKIVVTALFAVPALYPPFRVIGVLLAQAI